MKTTLREIRKHSPCGLNPREVPLQGYCKLRAYLGESYSPDAPVSIIQILDSNGLSDALWCLRAIEGYDREIRLYAVWCARQVQHLMTDPRSLAALDVAERYANGNTTFEELNNAYKAANAAAATATNDAAMAAADAARANAASAAYGAAAYADYAGYTAGSAQEKRLRELCTEIEARS